ncbi:MAG: leucine-rich repeat domain-containing protein, partial [Mycoplasmataceae bacterium]|nr:leucine-rich repeat domain-containing protein [Mycoplasmataceae bacterium]
MVNKLIIRNCLKKGAIFAGIIITLIAVPFLVVCNTEQFGNLGTNQGSKSGGNDQFSPKLNASVSNVDWQNPDVGYAVEFASTYGYSKSYLARIGAATNNALGKISHQSSYSKTETLLNFNLAGIGVSTTWGEAGASLLNEPTTNVSIIDFAADTVIPQVGTPYHIDPATPTRSLVDKITSVVISDYANVSSYSPITDIGFYSFSGLTRAFSQYDGTRSWYKANGSNTTSTFFNNLQSFKAQSSNNGEAGSGTKLGLTTVHNGAFYNATKLSTVDFGFDNRLTTFDEPYGPSEFQKTGFYPWPDVTGDFGRVNDQTTWNGIFENDTNLTSVELWQKYYGYDSKKENDAYQANFHEATLLNIPANLFKNCTKLTSFNTKVKNTAAIPFSVKTIGDSAFENAQLINNIIFSEDIKSIGRLGGTQNRYIQHFTFSQPNPSDELLNNLTNFALDNCNVGTVNYYVHVPYNYNDVSIRTNAYYRAIGGSARSNLFIQYTRPEKFLFLNWKTDLGAYSGVIGNEVDLDTNIIIKPLPEYSNVSGMNSYFATKKGVTATAPILIKWPSDTLQQWYDGFLIQLRIYNENGISGVKNVSLTATQYFDENYLDGYATNISVTSKSATAKISFYNINTSSITFYDDGIVGGTSGTNTLPVMRGDTGYMGSDGDWKNVALRGLVSAVEIPDTGPYAGVSLSFSEITLDRKNGTPVTTLPTIPSWITLEDIHIFQKPGDISTVITSYYLKIAPTVFSEVGVYQFKILATANLNTAISKASSKLSVQIYDVFDYTYSPVFPAVFDQSPTAACGLDSYHTEYFVNKRGGISGGNKENIINGSFALPTLNVTWVNGYAPSSISTKLSYTTTAMSLNGALYNGDEWISIKNSKLSYDSNLLTQGYVVQQMAADVNGNYSDIILISITATTMNENWLVTKTFIYYIRITLTTSAVWT